MNRRDFLVGTLCGASGGLAAAVGSDYVDRQRRLADAPVMREGTSVSFAQQGEDLIVKNIFDTFHIQKPTYIDIGAWDPIISNNTFLFYLAGSRGVLVEPNPAYTARLKRARPRDTVLNVGIGVTDQTEADYYLMASDQLNTFSKQQADKLVAIYGRGVLKKVVKMPLVNINKVLSENFASGPNFFSIDIEGLDLDILKTLDFSRFRPEVFCVETLEIGTTRLETEIVDFMQSKGYLLRGGTFVNSIFIDSRLFKQS